MDAAWLVQFVSIGMICCGVAAAVLLGNGWTAPYGRYSRDGWGPLIGARTAWVAQESFALTIPLAILLTSSADQLRSTMSPAKALLLSMFSIHYLNRTVVYPLRIRGGHPMPLLTCLLAIAFCTVNGTLQGWWLVREKADAGLRVPSPLFLAGAALWAMGLHVNLRSDAILRNLRRPGVAGYSIPRGGMFEYVSGANFFGEILEWGGWALAARRLPATAFALFTVLNIGPRALQHHRWYLQRFGDAYPKTRCALIPFLL